MIFCNSASSNAEEWGGLVVGENVGWAASEKALCTKKDAGAARIKQTLA